MELLEEDGCVVVLKWDGQRKEDKRTVSVSKPGRGDSFRKDSDDIEAMLDDAIAWSFELPD